MNYYRVTFDTKKGGYYHWVIDLKATSVKWAKLEAEAKWYDSNDAHMFHVEARKIKDTEEVLYHWFTKIDGKEV